MQTIERPMNPSVFMEEAFAAGLGGEAFSVSAEAVFIMDEMPGEKRDALLALVEAHDPTQTPPPPVPASVFDYQFAGEAEARGFISAAECDAWVGPGIVPATLLAKVEQIITEPAVRRRVVLFLKGSKEFPRYHENTVALAALFGLVTAADLDAFFVAARQR